MRHLLLSAAVLGYLGIAGCTASHEEPAGDDPMAGPRECWFDPADTCDPGTGSTLELTVGSLGFAGFDDDADPSGPIDGFDLDCRVSDRHDVEGCSLADRTSHDGQPGIDNSMGASMDVLGIDVDPERLPALAIHVSGIADASDDECVTVTLLDADTGRRISTSTRASIVGGQLHARMRSIELSLPLVTASESDPAPVEGGPLVLVLDDAHLSADLSGAEVTGLIGGSADADPLIDAFAAAFGDTLSRETIRTLVAGATDMSLDASGSCDHVSAALALTATAR